MRVLTAIYRTHAAAASVRRRLLARGLGERVHLVPSHPAPAGPLGVREEAEILDALPRLRLSEADRAAYGSALRRGDYLVSVTAGDDDVLAVIEVMRSPEQAVAEAARHEGCIDLDAHRRDRRRRALRHRAPPTERTSQ